MGLPPPVEGVDPAARRPSRSTCSRSISAPRSFAGRLCQPGVQEAAAWDLENERPDPEAFGREILPAIQGVSLGKLAQATGLSVLYCGLVRGALRVPPPAALGGAKKNATRISRQGYSQRG